VPKRPQRKPAQSRAGRKPMRPTKRQRHAVEVGVSIGLTVDQIAAAIAMSRRTVYCHFRDELASGRAKRLLANAVRLDAMAAAGNVSAAKYLTT
jgi:transcriptional regulator GlxA family with amidase domain